jgi:hypothetical protein
MRPAFETGRKSPTHRRSRIVKSLPRTIVVLIFCLTIFYNIERLDFGKQNVVDIASFVYILALFAVISLIWLPALRRSNVFVLSAMWVAVYLAIKSWLSISFGTHPLLGGVYTYLSITELSLLLITVLVAHKVASALEDFQGAVAEITLSDGNRRIRQIDEATDEIQLEMFRSRHYHHPVGIVVVKPEPAFKQMALHRAVQEVQQAMMRTYVMKSMAKTFSSYIRRTDLILEQRDLERFIILCPDTNASDLELMVEYLHAVAQERLGAPIACGTATFPDEAITFEELIHTAESRLNHRENGDGSDNGVYRS